MTINAKSQSGYTKIKEAFDDIHATLRIKQRMATFYYDGVSDMLNGLEEEVFTRTIELVILSYDGFNMPKRDQWTSYIKKAKEELKKASESSMVLYNGMPVHKPYYRNEIMPTEEDQEKSRKLLKTMKRRFAKKIEVVDSCEQ